MSEEQLRELSINYFDAFSNCDIARLSKMYHQDIQLVDWVVDVKGKEEVLHVNRNLFDLDFELELLEIEEIQNTNVLKTINRISIHIKAQPPLKVLDVITFDEDGKITKIYAMKV
jgi:ketosteroid isomerase-like protein